MAEILEFPSLSSISRTLPQGPVEEKAASALPEDAAARELALDTQQSFIVEAPAGSGKTGLLMQRFLNLLCSPATAAPEEILAITFTRKATAELRERIFEQLEAAAADTALRDPASPFERKTRALAEAVLQRDGELGWHLLTDPRRLRIETIDALCIEIAGTLPLLSGSAARTPVDDASELYRQAARNTLRQLGGKDRPLHEALQTVLLHRDGSLADVETLLAEMLQTREQWAELVPLDRASLSDEALDQQVRLRLERTLERIVCAGLTHALRAIPVHALAELAALAHTYAGEPGYRGGPNPFQLCSSHPGPPAAEAAHLDHWHALIDLLFTGSKCEWRKRLHHNDIGIKLSKFDKERLQSIIAEIQCDSLREALEAVRCLPSARYPDDQWAQAKALFRLLLHALAELRLLFAETGECDFTEFSLSARLALAHLAEDFAARSGAGLRHLLVDEMQDTSSAQYELLTALTGTWDGSSQTLFLVGDPKQSIYLFRQARVERFLRTARDARLGDVPLHALQLTANFRSRPALVTDINQDFARLFSPPGQPLAPDTVDVPFVAAAPTRSGATASGVQWHTRILPRQQDSPAEFPKEGAAHQNSEPSALRLALAASAEPTLLPQQEDAAAIRQIVEHWRARPLPSDRAATPHQPAKPWRIAVLAYARRHLAPIVAEFQRIDSGRCAIPYRAVKVEPLGERPEVLDAVALTRALHHPADRTAWFAVLRAPWCGLDAADLLTLADEADPAHTKSTVPQLVEERTPLLSETARQHLQRAWPILKAALELSSRSSFCETLQRTWHTLGVSATLNASERINVERYLVVVRDVEGEGAFDLRRLKRRLKELYAEPAEALDAVELMTIHSAKGLEWDVVLVPELGRQGQRERSRLLNWLELESGPDPAVLLAPIQGKGDAPSPLYQWLNKVHSRRQEAERKRVFYVACTRAREALHLFATAKESKAGLAAAQGSLLQACWPAASAHFEENGSIEFSSISGQEIHSRFSDSISPRGFDENVQDPTTRLALAAAAAPTEPNDPTALAAADRSRYLPRLTRLPLSFDPEQRFRDAAAQRLPYTPASGLPRQAPLARPEGSAAVRALGNVVHRFLERIATRLASSQPAAQLQAELPAWLPRLIASLRGEGLAPAEASREADRALTLLSNTLADPVGLWLLSPHTDSASERPLATAAGLLRVDRTFLAGSSPLSSGNSTLWVVDFKTTEHGGRSAENFAAQQRATYGPQLARYATALQPEAGPEPKPIQLGLYFPAIPRLIHWPAET